MGPEFGDPSAKQVRLSEILPAEEMKALKRLTEEGLITQEYIHALCDKYADAIQKNGVMPEHLALCLTNDLILKRRY